MSFISGSSAPASAASGAPPSAPRRIRRRVLFAIAIVLALLAIAFARFAVEVRALQSRHATGPAWSYPARIWSAPVPLLAGRALPAEYLRDQLVARGYRQVGSPRAPGEWTSFPGGAEIVLRAFDGPDPGGRGVPERVRLRFGNGRLVSVKREAFGGAATPDAKRAPRLEPVLLAVLPDSNRVYREWVPLARMPRALQQAVVASEDRRFRSHMGLDLKGNARAIAANVRAGGVRQGASTITQQLARGLWLGTQRTMTRKLAELCYAFGLELVLSKDEILEMYLNSVYFGRDDHGGIAGAAEASRRFFGVPVDSLSLDQAALLVGVIPAPNLYSPLRRPDNALRRRFAVLHDMYETGAIDSVAMNAAANAPLTLHPVPPPRERFPSFMSAVRQELGRQLPKGALEGWGLSVFTTCDLVWQQNAEVELARGLDAQEAWRGRGFGPLQGAFVLLDPPSGEVRAIVGGRDPGHGDFNRATQAVRQPGSAIKPIVYATALDPRRGGKRFTPGSTVPDLRREFATPEGPWQPRNDEGDYHETVTLSKALCKSLNLATANLVDQIGPANVARYVERFGLGKPEAVASIGLGTHEVTPLALVDAYTVFVNGGWRREPTTVRAIADSRGVEMRRPERRPIAVLPEAVAALARGMLENVVTFGISYPLRASYGFTRPCGGKTGTTNDYHDAWFVGFTPDVAAGVWVGYDQPQSLSRPAAKVALPVWAGVMSRLLEGFPASEFPSRNDEVLVWVDPFTGLLARGDCPAPLRVPFLKTEAPTKLCARDHAADWEAIRAQALSDSLSRAASDSLAAPVDSTESGKDRDAI
jgi:penicillin-binding protein 1B